MSDDYTEIVEWLLDLSSRLQAPGLENAADVIDRLRAELAAERERAVEKLSAGRDEGWTGMSDDDIVKEARQRAKAIRDLVGERAGCTSELIDRQADLISSLRAELAAAQEEIDAYKMDGSSAAMEVAELRGRLQGARDERDTLRAELAAAKDAYKTMLAQAESDLDAARAVLKEVGGVDE